MLLDILNDEFTRRKLRNNNYSLRAFARALKVHSSTLSAILNGKRKITPRQAQKILIELGVSAKERKHILLKLIDKTETPATAYHELSQDIINAISGWEHFALLSCLDLDSLPKTTGQIAEKMDLKSDVVEAALQRLDRLNLVRKHGHLWSSLGINFTTTHEIPNEAVRKLNREYIQKALVSLDNDPLDQRDMTGITMAISTKKIGLAKKMIASFRRDMCELLEADSRDQVYRLNIQLFPLTK